MPPRRPPRVGFSRSTALAVGARLVIRRFLRMLASSRTMAQKHGFEIEPVLIAR
jgi:hypothetical protein